MKKTPEEIKKGLECCANAISKCEECPYHIVLQPSGLSYCEGIQKSLLADGHAYIQQLEAQVPRWISVEEKLPPIGEVLISFQGCCVTVAWHRNNGEFELGSGLVLNAKMVSHWMPLPEPAEEDAHG